MKKKIIPVLLGVLLLVSSCSAYESPIVHTMYPGQGTEAPETVVVTTPPETVIVTVYVSDTDKPLETAAPGDETTSPAETEAPKASAYTMKVKNVDLGKGSIATLTFPQLENAGNDVAKNNANESLEKIALDLFSKSDVSKEYTEKINSGVKVTLAIKDCTVTYCTSALMCVKFTAMYSSADSEDVNDFVYTFLLNPSTGSEIKRQNVYVKTSSIKPSVSAILTLLKENKMTKVYSTQGFDAQLDISEWVETAVKNSLYNITPQIYFSETDLFVVVEASGKLGGWAEYSVPLDQVRQYLKVCP